jgi:hypothetical protein
VGLRGTRRLAQFGGGGTDMRVAAFTWRIGGVVGAGVCEAVWWVVVEEEAAAEEAGQEGERARAAW